VPILETSATSGQGIEALVDAIVAHKAYLRETQTWRERQTQRARASVRIWLQRHFEDHFDRCIDPQTVATRIQKVAAREQDPSSAARALLEAYLSQIKTGGAPTTP
jgi:LAO/AO transport system kinase